MSTDQRTLRADARRNRERIMSSGRELFAREGPEAQMDEIAAHAGVGIGTVYRHFPTKEALLTEMVRVRFQEFAAIATLVEDTADPRDALETVMRRSAEAVEGDVGFQLAMMGSNQLEWEGIEEQKAVLAAVVTRIIRRAVECRCRPRRLHLRGFRNDDVWNHLDDVLQARQRRLASPPSDHSPRCARSSPGC